MSRFGRSPGNAFIGRRAWWPWLIVGCIALAAAAISLGRRNEVGLEAVLHVLTVDDPRLLVTAYPPYDSLEAVALDESMEKREGELGQSIRWAWHVGSPDSIGELRIRSRTKAARKLKVMISLPETPWQCETFDERKSYFKRSSFVYAGAMLTQGQQEVPIPVGGTGFLLSRDGPGTETIVIPRFESGSELRVWLAFVDVEGIEVAVYADGRRVRIRGSRFD